MKGIVQDDITTMIEVKLREFLRNTMKQFNYLENLTNQIIRTMTPEQMVSLHNDLLNMDARLKLEEKHSPLYFNFFKRILKPHVAKRLTVKYIRKSKNIEYPENFERRHEILKSHMDKKKTESDPLSDFIELEDLVQLPKVKVDHHKDITQYWPFDFNFKWVMDKQY